MSAAATPYPPANVVFNHIARAGLTLAVVDGLFSSALNVFAYHSTVTRLWQGVASTLIGPRALEGGIHTASIGVLMHIGVAFAWSSVFALVVMRSAWIRGMLGTPAGTVKVAALYGPPIWLVMSLLVIPTLLHRPPSITYRWWIQLAGHFPFVGLPIVSVMRRSLRDSSLGA